MPDFDAGCITVRLRHILFRDYLRRHPEAVQSYRQVKEEILAKVGQENRQGYVELKEAEYGGFFDRIIQQAREETSTAVHIDS